MKIIVIENSYPKNEGVARAEVNDIVHWEDRGKGMNLVRESDGKTVFNRSFKKNDDRPMVGIVAQIKNKGYQLILEDKEA